ncbi:MAG: hypothetical protein HZA93_00930 [Verrucomicrobia bacterium]|nr:hypothetical protein [Verrucomicrobiota bacterium]
MLAMPARWRRFWPVLVAPAGLALQTLVVWLGTYANLPGTRAYAWWAEAVPLALLIVAGWRRGSRGSPASRLLQEARRFGMVFFVSAACLALEVLPLARASKGLTTISLGSCDAADYAGGARVLMEFARSERGGFVGQTEVVRTRSVDNFADYWLRLNHFGPAAVIALNGSILHCAPHELTSLMMMVLFATTVPLVFWSARAIVRHRGGASVLIAALFSLSPVAWYGVAHVAMGQMIAAQAIVVLTWAGVALWRGRVRGTFGGVLAVGYALVLGSYTFALTVALVPAVAFATGWAVWRRDWQRFGWWVAAMVGPLLVAGVVFAGRMAGLVEFFQQLQTFDFGWKIPLLTPEGWIGLVRWTNLAGWAEPFRWMASGVVLGLLAWAVARQRHRAWLAASVTLPVLAGYSYLHWRGAVLGTNASYDAYKLFVMFLPVMLPVFCLWLTVRGGIVLMGMALLGSVAATTMFTRELANRALMVDGELRQLRTIEAMADVKSVNMLVPDMWSRLWANYFLLRKQQFFATDTYEARWHTALKGEWDLAGDLIGVFPGDGESRPIGHRYTLIPRHSLKYVSAALGNGWHAEENDPKSGVRWRWTKGDATVTVENPLGRPVFVTIGVDGWSPIVRDLAVECAGKRSPAAEPIGPMRAILNMGMVLVPPGTSTLTLRSSQPAQAGISGDARPLGICVFGVRIVVTERGV